ncbi:MULTISPECIES: hypothetical protein [unclassified Variovorax]|uniref:hypothetical protein n=1 Tax=unclassified Variovorax TaxID=663243 RepID=UPI001BD2FFD8|nr:MULTISPECIES: hypothetical protein [unclassified Variovorax]
MYKPSDFINGRKQHGGLVAALTGVAVVAAAGIALQWHPGATAGIATTRGDDLVVTQVPPAPLPPPPAPAAPSRKVAGTYQLRCWQYGRLLFDEGPVTLGAEARQGAKMVGTDRNGGALFVTADLGGTTCLARPSPPPPNLAMPR